MTTRAKDSRGPSRLTKLRPWLTVPEAARYLALVFGEEVTEADVLRLGLDGHLTLSVRFVNFAQAVRHREPTAEELAETLNRVEAFRQRLEELRKAHEAGVPKPPLQKPALTAAEQAERDKDNRIVTLRDETYDLPMIGGERHDVEHLYQQQTGGPEVTLIDLEGPFVDSADGTRYTIRERLPVKEGDRSPQSWLDSSGQWYPPGRLPEDSVIVVRAAALRDFEQRVIGAPEPSHPIERPLKERERATLLTIIAVLAETAGLDISMPSKAAVAIEALTIQKGARVSARTIEDHLKSIGDALERRGKLPS